MSTICILTDQFKKGYENEFSNTNKKFNNNDVRVFVCETSCFFFPVYVTSLLCPQETLILPSFYNNLEDEHRLLT